MTNGITDEAIKAYAATLLDLEAEIETRQGIKKDTYASVRDTYGKKAADALKLAIKRHRMDDEKRNAADELDAEAERFLSVIRAPRATHAIASSVPDDIPHDADGVVIEDEIPGNGAGGAETEASVANVGATASANPIPEPVSFLPADPLRSGAATRKDADALAQEPHSEPAVPLTQERGATGDRSAELPAAAPVAGNDYSKPNPICQDPDDCGVNASWNHTCGSCLRRVAAEEAARAVQ